MQLAIDEAYNHHDACTQPLWDMMTFTGDRPTPEEFMLQIAMMLDEGTVYYSDVRYMAHSGLSF